jgi:Ca2+-binding RTX toxin-like protein
MATIINVAPPTGNAKLDMAAIAAAIKAANAEYQKNPGGGQVTVKLAAGVYAVTGDPENPSKGGVELLSGVSLAGEGMGKTVIKLEDGFNARINGIVRTALTDVSDASVSNLTIDGNRTNNTDHQAGFICGAKAEENKVQSNITLSGVEVRNCTAYGINPHEVTTNVTIENCVAHGNGLDGFVADFVNGGTYRNNVAYDNGRHGFNIQNATSNLVLQDNKAYDNGSAGLTIQRGDILPSGHTTIPWVMNVQVLGGEYYRNAKEGILVKLSDDVSIIGARIYGNLRQGIRVEGSSDTLIRDSFIFNNSQEADHTYDEIQIRLRSDDAVTKLIYYSTNTQILNNTIYSDGMINARYGIREEPSNVSGGPTGTIAFGNKITGMDVGAISIPGFVHEGTAGDDVMGGTQDADTMHGLAGNDTYTVNHSGDIVVEQADEGTDDHVNSSITYTLTANVEHLTLTGLRAINGYGNALNNRIIGNSANNVIKAAGGDDTLNGGGGIDTLEGGDGNDIYYIDSATDLIVEKVNNGLGGVDTLYSSVSYTLPSAVEKLILTGSAITAKGNSASGNNLIGNALNNILDGLAGEDRMEGGLGDDTYYVDDTGDLAVEAVGGGNNDHVITSVNYTLSAEVEHLTAQGVAPLILNGNDLNNRITGNAAANTLKGGAGSDTLNGGAGADSMEGGVGNDTYYVDNIGDRVTELTGSGTDKVYSSINYALGANMEQLTLTGTAVRGTGNELSNILVGNSSSNILSGGAGADRMHGGTGNDTYYVDDSNDLIVEISTGGSADKVMTRVSYALSSYVENMTGFGNSALNLTGNNLNNTLTGNAASNIIKGAGGNDVVNGGAGNDSLYGGTGNDAFIFNTALSSISNRDKVFDFDPRYDTIKLENTIFRALTSAGTLNSAYFTLGSSAKDSNDYIGYNKTTGDVWYDYNGNKAGGHVSFASIGVNKSVTYADFIVI